MSILTRPLTECELEAAGIEPAVIAHETFTQMFAVDRGELEIVDEPEGDDTLPQATRITPAIWAWGITMGVAAGALFHFAGGGQ